MAKRSLGAGVIAFSGRRTIETNMDGLLNVDKPIGLTSAQALYRVRSATGQRKSGHAGSLDPLADGVVLMCLGRATKRVEALMNLPKIYRTIVRLDITTDSFDLEREPVLVSCIPPTADEIAAALRFLEGMIYQTPPTTSAVKIRGCPAYRLERTGQPVSLQPRPVQVYWIHLHEYAWPRLDLEVACGRGTYIRALARDLGAALNCGGCLTELHRTSIGPFLRADALSLEQLEKTDLVRNRVIDLPHLDQLLSQDNPPPRPAS